MLYYCASCSRDSGLHQVALPWSVSPAIAMLRDMAAPHQVGLQDIAPHTEPASQDADIPICTRRAASCETSWQKSRDLETSPDRALSRKRMVNHALFRGWKWIRLGLT